MNDSVSRNDLIALYQAVLEKRRYESARREYDRKGFLSKLFTFPPHDKFSVFADSYTAESAFKEAVMTKFPELHGNAAGNYGPGQYRVDLDMAIDGDGTPRLSFRVSDNEYRLYHQHSREYDSSSGNMIASYQHDSDPRQDRENRNFAAEQESVFLGDALKGVYASYAKLCHDILPACVKENSVPIRRDVEDIYRRLVSWGAGKSDADSMSSSLRYDREGKVDNLTDYKAAVEWMNKATAVCLRNPGTNTKEVIARFEELSDAVKSYEKKNGGGPLALLYEGYAVRRNPLVGDFESRKALVDAACPEGMDVQWKMYKLAKLSALSGEKPEKTVQDLLRNGFIDVESSVFRAYSSVEDDLGRFRQLNIEKYGVRPNVDDFFNETDALGKELVDDLCILAESHFVFVKRNGRSVTIKGATKSEEEGKGIGMEEKQDVANRTAEQARKTNKRTNGMRI